MAVTPTTQIVTEIPAITRAKLMSDPLCHNFNSDPISQLHVSVAVPLTVFVLLVETGAVAVIVTAPFVAPKHVAVPLSFALLLIETLTVSEAVHVWPEQFTHPPETHWPFVTGPAKN